MRRITNITDEPIQRHTIIFEESEITLTLRFFPRHEFWAIDIEYSNYQVFGIKLSIGVLHITSGNMPFDFVVVDASNNGIDPFRRNDFSDGRCNLYMFEREDMIEIRQGEVVPV